MPRPRLSVPALRCRACPCDGQRVRHHPRRARESPLVTLPEHPGDSGRIFPGGGLGRHPEDSHPPQPADRGARAPAPPCDLLLDA